MALLVGKLSKEMADVSNFLEVLLYRSTKTVLPSQDQILAKEGLNIDRTKFFDGDRH